MSPVNILKIQYVHANDPGSEPPGPFSLVRLASSCPDLNVQRCEITREASTSPISQATPAEVNTIYCPQISQLPRGRSMILGKPCPSCGGSVSTFWFTYSGMACPTCRVHLKPNLKLRPIFYVCMIPAFILLLLLRLLTDELSIQIPGGTYSFVLTQILVGVILYLFIFKKHVTLLVDDGKAKEPQSNIRSEREKNTDH